MGISVYIPRCQEIISVSQKYCLQSWFNNDWPIVDQELLIHDQVNIIKHASYLLNDYNPNSTIVKLVFSNEGWPELYDQSS